MTHTAAAEDPGLLTKVETCARLGIAASRLNQLMAAGMEPAPLRLYGGRVVRFSAASVEAERLRRKTAKRYRGGVASVPINNEDPTKITQGVAGRSARNRGSGRTPAAIEDRGK